MGLHVTIVSPFWASGLGQAPRAGSFRSPHVLPFTFHVLGEVDADGCGLGEERGDVTNLSDFVQLHQIGSTRMADLCSG